MARAVPFLRLTVAQFLLFSFIPIMSLDLGDVLPNIISQPPESPVILTTPCVLHVTETQTSQPDREEALKKIKRDFSRNHAMAIHLNAIGMMATVWYGVGLASKLRFVP